MKLSKETKLAIIFFVVIIVINFIVYNVIK